MAANTHSALGERIKRLRGKQSRKDFAYGFGISSSSLAHWEAGEGYPELDFLVKLTGCYGVSLKWLITGEDSEEPDDQLGYLRQIDLSDIEKKTTGEILPDVPWLAKRIRALRGNLTQQKFGELLGVSQSSIANYENGRLPDSGFIETLCNIFRVSADWLLFGNGDACKPQKESETLSATAAQLEQTSDLEPQKVSHAEKSEEQFKEIRALERELRQVYRENSELLRENADLLKENARLQNQLTQAVSALNVNNAGMIKSKAVDKAG